MSRRCPVVALLAVLAIGAVLRFAALDTRPLHHDEGVNWLFLSSMLRGETYRYDPSNYHGPLLYFMVAPLFVVFPASERLLRFWPALLGSLVPLGVWAFRRAIGDCGAVFAAALIAVSPTAVFFSRDLIHETWLVAEMALIVAAVAGYLRDRRGAWLVVVWIGTALLVATKETAPILLAALGAGGAAGVLARRGIAGGAEVWCDLVRARVSHGAGLIAAAVLLVLLFSSFLANLEGIRDMFRAYMDWTRTGVDGTGHEKYWAYFFDLMWRWERPALVLGLVGAALAALRRDAAVGAGVTGVALLLVHSAIPYKTPWLVISIVPFLAATAGYLVDRARQALPAGAPRLALGAVLVLPLIHLGREAYRASFVDYDDDRIPFVYSQTVRDHLAMVEAIRAIAAVHPDGRAMAIDIHSPDHFPVNFYLRDFTAVDWAPPPPTAAPVLLLERTQISELRNALPGPYRYREFGLRPGVALLLAVPEPLLEAAVIADREDWPRLVPELPLEALAAGEAVDDRPPCLIASEHPGADPASAPAAIEVCRPPSLHYDHEAPPPWTPPHGIAWRGYLEAPVAGSYEFALQSDDGSTLTIDGRIVIDNGGVHALATVRGRVDLAAGSHRLELWYEDHGGGAHLEWRWRPPGSRDLATVPMSVLSHDP